MSARPYHPKPNYWLQPWNKLLQQVPWTGTDLGFTASVTATEKVEPVATAITPTLPIDLPAKPMMLGFSKLLGTIPWKGSSAIASHTNRMKEVLV